MKQNEPSPTSLLHVPHLLKPSPHVPQSHMPWTKRQSLWAFLFAQLSTDADARRLVRTGAAQAAAPARPMLRSISRREISLSSITHRTAAVLPSRCGLSARVCPGSGGVQHRVLQTPVLVPHPVHPFAVMQTLPRP